MRVDTKSSSDPLRRRLRRLSAGERLEEALAFVRLFCSETDRNDATRRTREEQIRRSLRRTGGYEHAPEELAFGARIAWRNHARCIGRVFWKSLEVIDCRSVTDPDEIAARIVDHMALSFGDGRIRSMITIFAPVQGGTLPAYIESPQIIQYAGYVSDAGGILGDAQNVEITRIARSLGWQSPDPPGMFDILPIIVRERGGRRLLYELPRSSTQEVAIVHPEHPHIADLKLRWYAVPCVSNMILTIGGIDYPCAPFSGFYMGTEIASRDLIDKNRYDLLSQVAQAVGGRQRYGDPALWKDYALLELNRAVLYSFARAGVTIVDHHTASEQFMEFVHRERAAGRAPSSDWSWIVPPQASSACPVFHLPMNDRQMVPNFYHSRASDGANLRPSYDDEVRSSALQRWDRIKRRFRAWQRLRD